MQTKKMDGRKKVLRLYVIDMTVLIQDAKELFLRRESLVASRSRIAPRSAKMYLARITSVIFLETARFKTLLFLKTVFSYVPFAVTIVTCWT